MRQEWVEEDEAQSGEEEEEGPAVREWRQRHQHDGEEKRTRQGRVEIPGQTNI